jgi:ubiquitin C-terminal hydrolase
MFNRFVQRIYDTLTVYQLDIFEDTQDVNTSVPEIEQGEDTTTFLNNYIDHIETDLDKNKIKEKVKELYQEASE